MFATLYKLGEVYFFLLGTTGFHIKAKMKNLALQACVVVGISYISKYGDLTSLLGKLRQKNCIKQPLTLTCRTCSTCNTIILRHEGHGNDNTKMRQ